MGDKNEPTGGTTLATAAVNSEFSSQTNILANMEGDVKGREVLLNKDSPSGTLERDSMDIERKKSPGKKPNTETVDGFQRFDVQEENNADCNTKKMYRVQKKNSRYYFQHPYCRLIIAYIICFFNFLIFAEDPVSHSLVEAELPVIGNDVGFFIFRYPPAGWSVLKVFLMLCGIAVGMIIGKFIVHKRFLRKTLKLQMFRDDQGSWMIMFLTTIISLFIFSFIFNGFLSIGSDLGRYKLSSFFGVSNANFMKLAALGTWTGDFVTAWMVTDMMLQEKLYPSWAVYLRSVWRRKWHRIIAFWTVWILATIIVATAIATDYLKWDDLNRDFVSTNELSRAFLASVILVMDLLIVMQDWDFPNFQSAIDIKLPGVNTSSFRIEPPRCLRKENWAVHVTGKWFNYGVIFIVMILDLNMWKNQIFYDPFTFGQYTDSEGYIYTVTNTTFAQNANKTTLSYDWRRKNLNPVTNRNYCEEDMRMNSKYLNYSLGVKGLAFIPSIVAFLSFGMLVWFYGRDEATAVVSAPSEVDGIVVDQWDYEEKPSDQDGKTSIDNADAKPRPKSAPIRVEEEDSTNNPVLTGFEMKTMET